jgi:hypothetical protein
MSLYQYVTIERNNLPMNKEHAWIIGLEAPDGRRVGIDEDGVAAYGYSRKGLCAIIHGLIGGTSVDDLELVAMHVPRMAAGIEVIDHYFNTLSLD